MPVARYFLFIGGVLLALLFVIDALAPQQTAVASNGAPSVEKYTVRIKSDRKLPERVVYDTSLPTIVPPTATVVAAAAPLVAAPETSAQARVRDTFAQFVPGEARKFDKQDKQLVKQAEKQPEPLAPKKRKVAKAHPSPPQVQPPMRFAQQQQHFGLFGGPGWNSTW